MTRGRLKPVRLLLGASLLGVASGCNILGALAYKAQGPDYIEPQFKPGDRPTMVLADAARDSDVREVDADTVARYVDRQLTEKLKKGEPPTPIVAADKAIDARSRQPKFASKSIATAGRDLGASQVIYIELRQIGSERFQGADVVKSFATADLRVVDAETGRTLWPTSTSDGASLSYETPSVRITDGIDGVYMRNAALRGLGDKIAKCFYRWQPDTDPPPKVVPGLDDSPR